MARVIAAQLGTLIDKAMQAGLVELAGKLEAARIEAERRVVLQESD